MPQLPELLLLRHGETEWNREGRFQGARDSRLTDKGWAQAVAMGRQLLVLGVGPSTHAALTSPQGRARDTAQAALSFSGLVAKDDLRLTEIGMGAWTGLCRDEIDRLWPSPVEEGLFDFYARCPGGEGLAHVANRVREVLGEIRQPTVMITHGVTLRILCALALGLPLAAGADFVLRQGCIVRIAAGRMEIL